MNLQHVLVDSCIAPRISAADKRQVLRVISEIAARSFGLKAPQILDALLEREASGSTGVGHGVAAPHAVLPGLDRMRGVFLRLESPVEFGAVDDRPVDLVFALFAPPDSSITHLRTLARILRRLRQAEVREQLRRAHTTAAIRALLIEEAQSSAA
jgi:PTS system nitrogen regulatory IIA component